MTLAIILAFTVGVFVGGAVVTFFLLMSRPIGMKD